MRLLACIAIGVIAGTAISGLSAIRRARKHDFAAATRKGRQSAFIAFLVTCLSTTVLFGWPWRPVVDTVMETVEDIVEVPAWIFFTTTKTEFRQVPTQVSRTELSVLSLVPMALVGALGALTQILILRTAWRWLG